MAKERRSLFERLTGSVSTNEEYEFEDLAQTTPKGLPEREEEPTGELAVDVYQTPTHLIIKAMIAGVRPEDLDISFTNDTITIRGLRKKGMKVKDEDYFYNECYWGGFSRSIILPVDVQEDKIDAKMENGILTITIPKNTKPTSRSIPVKEIPI